MLHRSHDAPSKIVVTDDQGRYLIPDLPAVDYSVWVRGYGLIDSPKMRAKPSMTLDLKAVPAPNEAEAAHYYPAICWYTMMKIPPASDFGGSTAIPAMEGGKGSRPRAVHIQVRPDPPAH